MSAVSDLRGGRIPNIVTYPAIMIGLSLAAAGFGPGLTASAVGLLVGGGALFVLFAAGGMGGGDVKLMAAVGAIKGYPFILSAMFYSIFMGGVAAALLLVWQGHFLDVAGDVWTLVRRLLVPGLPTGPIPSRGGTFPFGVAICLGTFTALALQWWR
jgi:prepilin peptidase CpaA